MVEVDMSQLREFNEKLKTLRARYPDEVNSFMRKTATGFRNSVKKEEDPRWKNRIGHDKYTENEGWKPFRQSRYTKFSDKVVKGINTWAIVNNRRYYERFVNDGHAIRRKKRGPVVGHAKPTHHIDKGVRNYEPTAFTNLDSFVDDLIKRTLW